MLILCSSKLPRTLPERRQWTEVILREGKREPISRSYFISLLFFKIAESFYVRHVLVPVLLKTVCHINRTYNGIGGQNVCLLNPFCFWTRKAKTFMRTNLEQFIAKPRDCQIYLIYFLFSVKKKPLWWDSENTNSKFNLKFEKLRILKF